MKSVRFLTIALLGAGQLMPAPIYRITSLGILPGGTNFSPAGLNANGDVVGSGDSATLSSTPVVWSAGSGLTAIDWAGSPWAFGTGINDLDTVVGYGFDGTFSTFQAYLSNGSSVTTIPTLTGGTSNAALAINNAGTVVGYSETVTPGGNLVAFSYDGTHVTNLGTLPGGTTSSANAINSSGHIAGQSDSSADPNLHPAAFLSGVWIDMGLIDGYQAGVATAISNTDELAGTLEDGTGGSMAYVWTVSGGFNLLGTLGTGSSNAYGVNSSGYAVGSSDVSGAYSLAAFLYADSALYDLNSLLDPSVTGWHLDSAQAINDSGQIVGIGEYGGQQTAFLLTPEVPEPNTFWMTGGLVLLLAIVKFRSI
jgi:probable HAF family extracellular repeat protein